MQRKEVTIEVIKNPTTRIDVENPKSSRAKDNPKNDSREEEVTREQVKNIEILPN